MMALIDADILVFRCGFAAEHMMWYLKIPEIRATHESDTLEFRYKKQALEKLDEILPGIYSRREGEDYELWSERQLEPPSHAFQNINTLMESIQTATDTNDFCTTMYLSSSSKDNFRYDVATTRPYKGNRDAAHRPTHEEAIRAYIIENWDTRIADGEEADDLLGIAQTKDPEGTILISIDKDLNQIPGLKYNFVDDRIYTITPEQGDYNFYMQLLTGDTTDNIPGLPGIGPGKAAKALHGLTTIDELEEECWRMYQIHSGTTDPWAYMREQGQLLWIRRFSDEMWEPSVDQVEGAWEEALSLY